MDIIAITKITKPIKQYLLRKLFLLSIWGFIFVALNFKILCAFTAQSL